MGEHRAAEACAGELRESVTPPAGVQKMDPLVASFQREIRHSGRAAGRLRLGLAAAILLLTALAWLVPVLLGAPEEEYLGFLALTIVGSMVFLGIYLTVIPLSLSALFRQHRMQRFYDRLSRLPRKQRAQVLLPLCAGESHDTLEIVEPLVQSLLINSDPQSDPCFRRDLVPAVHPAGQGTEIAPPTEAARTNTMSARRQPGVQ